MPVLLAQPPPNINRDAAIPGCSTAGTTHSSFPCALAAQPGHSHVEVGGVGALYPAVQGLDVLLHKLDLDEGLDHDLHLAVAVALRLVGDGHLR